MSDALQQHEVDKVLVEVQSELLSKEMLRRLHVRTDRLFALLMFLQFVAAILAALVISPRTWLGASSSLHFHVHSAFLMGGLFAGLPIYLVWRHPGAVLTRHVVAVAQVLFSALFIHLTGGRIETHFHIFGSLAFLAFYRDWRVLVPATLIVAIDHFVRAVYWPESVFGVFAAAPWRAFEHAGWLLFEDVFLSYSCICGSREIRLAAERQTRLEVANATVEQKVEQRTRELQQKTNALTREIEERHRLESQLIQAQKLESIGQLAAGIAHEINTPTQYVCNNTRFLEREFTEILVVLDKYAAQLDPDSPAQSWAERVEEIRATLEELDYEFLREEIPLAIKQSLEGVERITAIVNAMKDFSHPGSDHKEPADLNHAIESTTTVCRNRWKDAAELELSLSPELPAVPCLLGEFNQVILNLVVNAADAIEERFRNTHDLGMIRVSTNLVEDYVEVRVADNGGGIPEKVRQKIFDPFFTTKQVGKGTGQGLAISRDVIVEKHGGELLCDSKEGEGTTFIVRLPIHTQEAQTAEAQAA